MTEERDSDAAYFQRRAEQEVELARRARDPNVVAAHFKLAELHLERVAQLRSTPDSVDH